VTRTISALLAVALLFALSACAQQDAIGRAMARGEAGDLEGARTELERERELRPESVDVHVALGETCYRIAREALDRDRDEARYLSYLEQSVSEFVTALELDPRDQRPHFYLAVMDAYRGDLRRTLRGLNNARRLQPTGVAYTNIAEVYVYLGKLRQAREWNDLGLKKGAPYGAALFNDMLIAWRDDDLDEARLLFSDLRRTDPAMLATINMVRLPEAPRRFEDFAGYCCSSPACGPYMKEPCQALELAVGEREISNEALRKELRIEMEKRRRLQKVYEQRKDLEIEIEDEGSG